MNVLKRASVAAAIGAAFLVVGPIAVADGPYEPNESITQARGPMLGGTNYNGVIETSNDVDWFYFYIAGQRQFEVVFIWRAGTSCEVTLRDADGAELGSGYVSGDPQYTVATITHTSPGTTRYNLEVNSNCEGHAYTLQIRPADAVTSQPPTRCFNHVHTSVHKHRKRHIHKRRHRHRNGRIHIHRRVHIHRRNHIHRQNHQHCVPAP